MCRKFKQVKNGWLQYQQGIFAARYRIAEPDKVHLQTSSDGGETFHFAGCYTERNLGDAKDVSVYELVQEIGAAHVERTDAPISALEAIQRVKAWKKVKREAANNG